MRKQHVAVIIMMSSHRALGGGDIGDRHIHTLHFILAYAYTGRLRPLSRHFDSGFVTFLVHLVLREENDLVKFIL